MKTYILCTLDTHFFCITLYSQNFFCLTELLCFAHDYMIQQASTAAFTYSLKISLFPNLSHLMIQKICSIYSLLCLSNSLTMRDEMIKIICNKFKFIISKKFNQESTDFAKLILCFYFNFSNRIPQLGKVFRDFLYVLFKFCFLADDVQNRQKL